MEKKSVGSSQLGNECLCIRVSEETGCCHVPICLLCIALLCLCVRMNMQEENEEMKISLVRSGPVRSSPIGWLLVTCSKGARRSPQL